MDDKNNEIWKYISANNYMTSRDIQSLIEMLEVKRKESMKAEAIERAEKRAVAKWRKKTAAVSARSGGGIAGKDAGGNAVGAPAPCAGGVAEDGAAEETEGDLDIDMDFSDVFGGPNIDVENCRSAADALVSSVCNCGKVDIGYISTSCGLTPSEVVDELRGSIIQDPELWGGDPFEGWVTREEYLTGNLCLKKAAAALANRECDGRFSDNIQAIAAVMPPKVQFDDIFITLGSPWIPIEVYERFFLEVVGLHVKLAHDAYTGSWSLSVLRHRYSHAVINSKFGTGRMDAVELILRTMNLNSVVVRDDVRTDERKPDGSFRTVKVVNEKETQFLLERQDFLIGSFRDWVSGDELLRRKVEEIFYEKYAVNRVRHFDGRFLKLPGIAPGVRLYDYQKDAVARMLFSPNVLLAHDVGSGKTYEMIVAGHEMRRLGLSKKNMFVVPNGIVSQWKGIYSRIYPKDRLLVIRPSNFSPSLRQKRLDEIKAGNYDAVIIAYSSFGMIRLSPSFYVDKVKAEANRLAEINGDRDRRTPAVSRKLGQTVRIGRKLLDEIAAAAESGERQTYFEDLGIDRLFVDEAHNFKNISFDTKIQNVLGLNPEGSEKCMDMYDKVRLIHSRNGGGGVVFATATPITNSVSDVFVMQKYLQPYALRLAMVENFDGWVNMFSEIKSDFEVDVDTMKYRVASRLSRFHNLPELSAMLAEIADFHHIDKSAELPDFDGYENVVVPRSEEFSRYLQEISQRAEAIRKGKPSIIGYRVFPDEKSQAYSVVRAGSPRFAALAGNSGIAGKVEAIKDNMLVITTDGRKAALDIRLVNGGSFASGDTKSARCAEKVFEIYTDSKAERAAQLVFCDVSVPKAGFNIYDELRSRLISLGVRPEEIAYIHDAESDVKRDGLMEKVNEGAVRVLLGSTFKLGTGVNVQERLIAVHHIDVPWRPSDMIQREGRLLRPGNMCGKVRIFRYITEGSFDAYSWQLLETKQNFISSLLSNKVSERDAGEVDDVVLSYAEVKAIAIGNPLVKERVETYNELQRLRLLQSKLIEEKMLAVQRTDEYRRDIPKLTERLRRVKRDYAEYMKSLALAAQEVSAVDFGREEGAKRKRSRQEIDERKKLAEKIAAAVNEGLRDIKDVFAGSYFGFRIVAPSYCVRESDKFVYLEREAKYSVKIGDSPAGCIQRIDNFLNGLDEYAGEIEGKIKDMREYVESAEKDVAGKESHVGRIEELRLKLIEIDRKLEVNL